MSKKSVYTCETCSALYVCLKYFQEHRRKHALTEKRTIYPCTHCQEVFTEHCGLNFHSISHKDEPPHTCKVCDKDNERSSISKEEIHSLGARRSIGTGTEVGQQNNVFNMSLNNVPIPDNDDRDDDDDSSEEEDSDDDDDDDDAEGEEEEEEEMEEEDEDHKPHSQDTLPNVTNILCITNQTITHTTPQQKYLKPSRPSRSTGKGKGNRNARLTTDGDVRRKFSCCHCGKSFKTKSHLQRHILTHTGEKPYVCNRCDCRFNQSSSLRNHVIAIHTKEYPHACNTCEKGFLMPALLQRHLQSSARCGANNQVVEGL